MNSPGSMAHHDTGIVVIGRNEGERLERCLASAAGLARLVVYADSGSTDGSVERARSAGAEVVELDPSRPANAARGRNAGAARLLDQAPDLVHVFFVDGDCRIVPGFLDAARQALGGDPALGAVCGRRLEEAPDSSVYNRLVHTEWNTPVGETLASGGDVVVRVEALRAVGGYDESMSCGEDPEFCFRLRAAGWGIRRIDHDMTRHDVALRRFSSWWRRHSRGGYAYAHGLMKHFHGPEWFNLRAVTGILLWGAALPLAAVGFAIPTRGWSLLLFALHTVPWWRCRRWRIGLGDEPRHATTYATFVVLGKLGEAWGVARFLLDWMRGRTARYREYKEYGRPGASG